MTDTNKEKDTKDTDSKDSTEKTDDEKDKKTDTKDKETTDESKKDGDNGGGLKQIFTKSNIIIVMWFLGIYVVVSFIMSLTSTNYEVGNDRMVIITRMIDFVVLIFGVITLILTFFYKSESEKEQIVENLYRNFVDYMDKPITIVSVAVFLVVFYMLIMLLGIPMDRNKPITIKVVENFSWIFIALLLIAGFFKYVLNISISELLEKGFDKVWKKEEETAKDASNNAVGSKKQDGKNEVFNVANNFYSYEDAQAVCKSFGARLATYDEVEKAYTDGGEWCNYGWSANQSIYFPTQKSTWDKLQQTKTRKNDCGRPGVNGGFIDNPNARFGANCYGVKPQPNKREKEFTETDKHTIIPKTPEDKLIESKVDFFKKYRDDFVRVNAFGENKWSAL
jgi:hypothetical protein